MNILRELWRGQISPQDKYIPQGEEQAKLSGEMRKEYNKFIGELSEKGKQHFEAYEQMRFDIQTANEENIFIEAFRLGVRMILDTIGDGAVM